jgi:TonB family protein
VPGPLERAAKEITPENPIPRRTYSVVPLYPPDAAQGQRIAVTVRLTLDSSGRVAEARALGRGAMAFVSADGTAAVGGRAGRISAPPISAEAQKPLQPFYRAAVEAVRQWQYQPPASAPMSFDVSFLFRPDAATEVIGHGADGLARASALRAAAPPPPPPPPPDPAFAQGAIRVGNAVRQPTKIKHVDPVYPPIAQSARVQGVVILEARIDEQGRVSDARVLRSIPLLDQAALDAVRQWEFTPTLLNGAPTPVIMTMTVQFTLAQ